jgi:hypothetical protein
MASVGLRAAALRRAAPWLFATSLALGCGSSAKTSYGNDASVPDSSGAAGTIVDAPRDTGGGGAAGTGAPDAGDAASEEDAMGVDAVGADQGVATDAPRDAPAPDDAAHDDVADASGAAGSPAPPPCVIGSSVVGGCVVQ